MINPYRGRLPLAQIQKCIAHDDVRRRGDHIGLALGILPSDGSSISRMDFF